MECVECVCGGGSRRCNVHNTILFRYSSRTASTQALRTRTSLTQYTTHQVIAGNGHIDIAQWGGAVAECNHRNVHIGSLGDGLHMMYSMSYTWCTV